MNSAIDAATDILKRLGWSTGQLSYCMGYKVIWQVDAKRDGHTIIARAPTQTAARLKRRGRLNYFKGARQRGSLKNVRPFHSSN